MQHTYPNFVVIGSSRSGTTSLYHHLAAHPHTYVTPVMEPRFFAFADDPLDYRGPGDDLLRDNIVTSAADYAALYDGVTDEIAAGDISPAYLCSSIAAERIHRHNPHTKIIAILRNPVERAISSFRLETLDGHEPAATLSEALDLEETRHQQRWSYAWRYGYRGRYHQHLSRYYSLFDPDRIKVFRYDDWAIADGRHLLDQIYRFLDIEPGLDPAPVVARLNTTDEQLFQQQNLRRYEPTPAEIQRLRDLYRDDITGVEQLTGLELSAWR